MVTDADNIHGVLKSGDRIYTCLDCRAWYWSKRELYNHYLYVHSWHNNPPPDLRQKKAVLPLESNPPQPEGNTPTSEPAEWIYSHSCPACGIRYYINRWPHAGQFSASGDKRCDCKCGTVDTEHVERAEGVPADTSGHDTDGD